MACCEVWNWGLSCRNLRYFYKSRTLGDCDVAQKAGSEPKAQSRTGFGGRRVVIVAGGRSVRSRCASCGWADAQGSSESTKSRSARRKSRTSAWRHSMSSTRKMPDHRGTAKGWRVAAGRAPITRQEMMLIRPRFVRSRRMGMCRSTFRKARGKDNRTSQSHVEPVENDHSGHRP